MPHYKDGNGNVHFIDDAKNKDLLPDGCVEISDAELATIKEGKQKEESDKAKVEKDKVDDLWAEFDSASTVVVLKIAIKKILGK